MAGSGSTGFQPEALLEKLARLNPTQQSIQTVSSYCTFFRKVEKGAPAQDATHCIFLLAKLLSSTYACVWQDRAPARRYEYAFTRRMASRVAADTQRVMIKP